MRRELLDELRHQHLVAARLGRDADHVHVVLDRLARGFVGHLEERPDVDVEAEVGEGRGDDLHAAVMAVLPDLDDEHARPAALRLGEGVDLAPHRIQLVVVVEHRAIHPQIERISAR